jgi:hypothetical protein
MHTTNNKEAVMKTFIFEIRKLAIPAACSALALMLSACGGGSGDPAKADKASEKALTAPAIVPTAGPAAQQLSAGTISASVVSADGEESVDGYAPAALHMDDDSDVVFESGGVEEPEELMAAGTVNADFAVRDYGPRVAKFDQMEVAGSEEVMFATSDASKSGTDATRSQYRLYVSTKGSDSNPGTYEKPLRSIGKAARVARPGTRVLVAPGTYSGGIRTNNDGTKDQRIVFVSTTKWGAVIVPPVDSKTKSAWDNRGDYVDIVGFNVDGRNYRGGTRWLSGIYNGGSYDSIRNNRVHHIAKNVPCTSAGGSAIGVDSYYKGVQADVVANLVHDIGPAGCRFIQGIYVSTSGSVKNNAVYRVAEAGIHLWHDARDVIITNNTVKDSNTGIIVGGGDFYHHKGGNDRTHVISNLVVDNKFGISEQGKTGKKNSYRNNLVYGNRAYNWSLKNGLKHSDTVSEAPKLVGISTEDAPALQPASTSPAVGRGSPDHAESTDFHGRPRNARAGYDIGAFQHK